MANNDEIEILVYFMQIRDKQKNRYMGREDIKKLFSEINSLPYDRADQNSKVIMILWKIHLFRKEIIVLNLKSSKSLK